MCECDESKDLTLEPISLYYVTLMPSCISFGPCRNWPSGAQHGMWLTGNAVMSKQYN